MCGTGTFSIEAALIAKNIPPGWFREFAFMKWPAFRQQQWDYLKRQCEKHFMGKDKPVIYASDIDPIACRRLKNCLIQYQLEDIINVSNKNFFNILPRAISKQTGWIVLNPPYGKRMGDRQESQNLYKTISARLMHEYQGWKLILIAPSKQIQEKVPFKLKMYPLVHGGLMLMIMVGTVE
jgi:putative N6-adenine-specific DNA methylase